MGESSMPRRISLTGQVKQWLVERIADGEFKSGERIPSTRSLVKRLGISHVTAAAALRELNKEGWIAARAGCGSFVSPNPPLGRAETPAASRPSPSRPRTLYFLIDPERNQEPGSYHLDVLWELQRLADKLSLNLKYGSREALLETAAADRAALGVVAPYDTDLSMAPPALPVVRYGMARKGADGNYVTPDNFSGGHQAGRLLLDNGHRNVRYVSICPEGGANELSYKEIHWGLNEAFAEAGQGPVKLVRWNIQTDKGRRDVIKLLREVKSGGAGAPTCLVVGNKSMASEIYTSALTMEIGIPDDLSLVSFVERAGTSGYPISCFDFSHAQMAEEAAALLLRIDKTPKEWRGLRTLLPMRYKDAGSIRNLTA